MAHLLSARRVVHACGATASLAWAALAASSWLPPVPLPLFFSVLAVAWTAVAVAWWWTPAGRDFPTRAMLAWAVIFRLAGLAAHPVLEDDYYRYLWDGRATVVLGTPYGRAPEEWFGETGLEPPFDRVLDGINNPDVPTVYPPVAQAVFAAAYAWAPGRVLPIKALLVVADLLTLALLLRLVSARNATLYGWCPLVVHETAFNAHVDAIGVLFLVAAIALAQRAARGRAAAIALGGLAALAVASKALAAPVIPLLGVRLKGREIGLAAAGFAVAFTGVYLPFLAPLLSSGGRPADLAGLFVFLRDWEFNSTGFALLSSWAGRDFASLAALVGTAAVLGLTLRRARRQPEPAAVPHGEWVLACLFLLSPVVNPWYLLWLAPFVAARPTAWGLTALAVVPLSYCHGLFLAGPLPAYHHPDWVRPLELGSVLAAFAGSRAWRRRAAPAGPQGPVPADEERGESQLGSTRVATHAASKIGVVGSILLLALGVGAFEAHASGSYMGRPSRPNASIDRAGYELGKQVFAGEFVASEQPGERSSQDEILGALQERLPHRVRARVDLTQYAGRLSDEQLKALRYYLARRYKVKIDD